MVTELGLFETLREMKIISAYTDNSIYCITNSVDCYMFRPPIVAIFREMFFEEWVIWKIKMI